MLSNVAPPTSGVQTTQNITELVLSLSTVVSVSANSVLVLPSNSNRKRCLLLNSASNTLNIIVSFGQIATANDGILLPPGLSLFETLPVIYKGSFSCITLFGTADLQVFEWV